MTTTAVPGRVVFELIDDVTAEPPPLETSVATPWPVTHWAELPETPGPGDHALAEAMPQRRSRRDFSSEALPIEVAARVLGAGRGAGRDLDLLVWADCVAGLDPGLYVADGGGSRLGLLSCGDGSDPSGRFLQAEFGRAAMVVVTVADLADRMTVDGAHGYRRALFDGGLACNRMWLAACSESLVGSIFAGFIPAALRAMVPIDGLSRLPVLAFGCGWPEHAVGPGGGA